MPESDSTDSFNKRQPIWRVLLVQGQLGSSFRSIAGSLKWSASAKARSSPAIDWDSANTDSMPTMKSHISFVRHFAVCLIDKDVWISSLSIKEKFMRASFWEHPGESTGGNEALPLNGVRWGIGAIEKIDAIQELGDTKVTMKAIREHLYAYLFEGWEYVALWWNCQDFAISLALLIVGEEALHLLRWIRIRLSEIAKHEWMVWHRTVARSFFLGTGGVWTVAAVDALGLMCPPILALGWGAFALGAISGTYGAVQNWGKWVERERRMVALAQKFPEVAALCCESQDTK